jgi:hypothetical protein
MTAHEQSRTLASMDDLLDLRAQLATAVARRDAERPGTAAWQAAEAEIEALIRRVWEADEPAAESSLEAS